MIGAHTDSPGANDLASGPCEALPAPAAQQQDVVRRHVAGVEGRGR